MRKICLALLLFASAGLLLAPRAHAQTAAQLATDCAPYRSAIVVAPGPNGGVIQLPRQTSGSNFCWGAFATLEQLITLQDAGALALYSPSHPALKACVPATVGRLQLVQAFLRYMARHRDMGKVTFGPILLGAMAQTYPCGSPGG